MFLMSRGREFQTEGAAYKNKKRAVSKYFRLNVWNAGAEFLSQKRIGAVLVECMHEEDQTDKQGLYQRKGSGTDFIT